ncbi:hypothetical protein [Peribacillus sp. SCS-155]|uniref:hypothetical protein n=1 Tax=Peribacillus sedimenti TaxID=3115297 RepID=UPI00390670BA
MGYKIIEAASRERRDYINSIIEGMAFTKNFRSMTAEEWYVFIPGFNDPHTGGAAGKAIIHYNLIGNRDIFINTTIIFDDPQLHAGKLHDLVYSVSDEIINRIVGYADTLLSVHAGENSYQAEYKQ